MKQTIPEKTGAIIVEGPTITGKGAREKVIYKTATTVASAAAEPLPWPFGLHVAGYIIQDYTHTSAVMLQLQALIRFWGDAVHPATYINKRQIRACDENSDNISRPIRCSTHLANPLVLI